MEFFGYQLLQYLLSSVVKNDFSTPDSGLPDRIIRTKEVQNLTGLSRTSIWREEGKGNFPSRVSLFAGSVGWRYSEVMKWIENR